jgi:hypothetical protein
MSIQTTAIAVGIAALVITASHGLAYHAGKVAGDTAHQAELTRINLTWAKALADQQSKARQQEQDKAAELAAIADKHQQDIANREAISNRTIADLRAGTIRLRSDIAANEFAASVRLPSAAAGTGQRDAAKGVGLRIADAEFLIRTAGEADQVADQLRACQAVVRADRSGRSEP